MFLSQRYFLSPWRGHTHEIWWGFWVRVWGGIRDCASLISSQVLSMQLVWGPHFDNKGLGQLGLTPGWCQEFKVKKEERLIFFHGIIWIKPHQSFHHVCFYFGGTVWSEVCEGDSTSVVFYLLKPMKLKLQETSLIQAHFCPFAKVKVWCISTNLRLCVSPTPLFHLPYWIS